MPAAVSMVAWHHVPSLAAAAAWRSWSMVRCSKRRRGQGRPNRQADGRAGEAHGQLDVLQARHDGVGRLEVGRGD